MDFGVENATRLVWRSSPDLLLNEESLVDVIAKLRTQVQAIEKNELLSGTALPPWLLRALTEVAGSVDSVVECQALQDQVSFLQKEVLDLRHEILLQQSSMSSMSASGGSGGGSNYSPSPHHRLSTSGTRSGGSSLRKPAASPQRQALPTMTGDSSSDLSADMAAASAPALQQQPTLSSSTVDAMLKPLWDCIHKQTNDFAALRDAFKDAKDTVARLQSEIKRRDAVVQARNSKHESSVQSQVDKLNESLRACVTRNDLIGAEQRIAQQMKSDRQRTLDDVETRSNQLVDDLLTSRAEQEDINSMHGETMQLLTRKQSRLEELIVDLTTRQQDAKATTADLQRELDESIQKVAANTAALSAVETTIVGFVETQTFVATLAADMKASFAVQDERRLELEHKTVARIAESVAIVRSEVEDVNTALTAVVDQNLASELHTVAGKLDMVVLTAAESVKKISVLQKQHTTHEDQTRSQFTQAFDSLERIQTSMSTLSEESMRLSYSLQHVTQSGEELTKDFHTYCERTDHNVAALQKHTHALQADVDKTNRTVENEFAIAKNQLFHTEDAISALRRDHEDAVADAERNLRSQLEETQAMTRSLERLDAAKTEMLARQDRAESQVMAFQSENRAEIQAATMKLVGVVDKESDRIEALYTSFQAKQEHFADVVARSSIRNMELTDMNREIDRVCESFVQECWKFETSARSSSKASTRAAAADNNNTSSNSNSNSTTRKLFNERQQQLLVHNCQFIADLVVARAEYEVLQAGCNKDVKLQRDLDERMVDAQARIVDSIQAKMQTKIMNNKNIGEQFDKSTLDRRELYVDSVSNMLAASMKRRTMVGGGDRSGRDESTGGTSYYESQRLMGLSTAAAAVGGGGGVTVTTTRRKTVARDSIPNTRQQSISLVASGLAADSDATRSAFSPGAGYVYRAGFRLPKATPPSSPMTGVRSTTPSGLVLTGLGETTAIGEDHASMFDTSSSLPPEVDGSSSDSCAMSLSEQLLGWSSSEENTSKGHNQDSSSMAKSVSLPVLKQV